jgi:hypothetical protein
VNKKSKIPFHNLDEKNDEVLTLRRPALGWRRASLGTPGHVRVLAAGGAGVGRVLHVGTGGCPVTPNAGASGSWRRERRYLLATAVEGRRREGGKGGGASTRDPLGRSVAACR